MHEEKTLHVPGTVDASYENVLAIKHALEGSSNEDDGSLVSFETIVAKAERLHGIYQEAQESRRKMVNVLEEPSWAGLVGFEKEMFGDLKGETGQILLSTLALYDREAEVREMAMELQPTLKNASKIASRIAEMVE